MRQTLELIEPDAVELEGIVNDVINKKQEEMNKINKKKELETVAKHRHTCPSCQAAFEKKQEGFEICEGCGTVDLTIKKGERIAACDDCNGIIPESLIGGDNKECPHCGKVAGAHWL